MESMVSSPPSSQAGEWASSATASQVEEQIAALGPWFHNLRLRGIQTAPHHFSATIQP